MSFEFKPNKVLPDVLEIKQTKFRDERGMFSESFRTDVFLSAGLPPFVQENYSFSKPGTFRGLHYQLNPKAQGKLVYCAFGEIVDYVVDIRVGSPTYGKHAKIHLSKDININMVYVPPGFAHGFYVPGVHMAAVMYKVSEYYSSEHDRAINYKDPFINIGLVSAHLRVSDKDMAAPLLEHADNNFIYGG